MADQLEIINAEGEVLFYSLDPARSLTNIGRDRENDIVIDDPAVAPFQAVLDHHQKPYRLLILSQEGRVILEGQLLPADVSINLQHWDHLELGRYTVVLVESQPGQPPAGPIPAGPLSGQRSEAPAPPRPASPAFIPRPSGRPEPPPAVLPVLELVPPLTSAVTPTGSVDRFTMLPQNKVSDLVPIKLSKVEWTVDVEQTAAFELSLTNGGDRVAMFQIFVEGLDESWVQVLPQPQVNLFEGHSTAVTLTITPPQAPTSYAGVYYFAVVVTSPTYDNEYSQLGATLVVNPYYQFSVYELSPRVQTISWFRRSAQTTATVINEGNSPAGFRLEGGDDEKACHYEFQVPGEPVTLTGLAPLRLLPFEIQPEGHLATVPITIVPHTRPLFLRRRVYPFTIAVTPLEGQQMARALPGELRQRPLLGLLPLLLLALLLFFLCGTSVWFMFGPRLHTFTVDGQVGEKTITTGQEVTLGWQASQFATLRLEPDIGRLEDSSGEVRVAPLVDTEYKLQARNFLSPFFFFLDDQTELTRRVTVKAIKPSVLEFEVDPDQIVLGEEAILSWKVEHADEVILKSTGGQLETLPTAEYQAQRLVSPAESIVYGLEASNFHGDTSRSVELMVVTPTGTPVAPPVIQSFNVVPGQIIQGESVSVNWSVAGADSVVINPIAGSFGPNGSVPDAPQVNTLYVLEARKAGAAPVSTAQYVTVLVPTGTPSPSPTPAAPEIEFSASKTELVVGEGGDDDTVTLFWTVKGAVTDVQLANSQNAIIQTRLTPQAQLEVPVDEESTLFTLIAYNQDKSSRKSVTLKVATATPKPTDPPPPLPTPQILLFQITEPGPPKVEPTEAEGTYRVQKNTKVTFEWSADQAAEFTQLTIDSKDGIIIAVGTRTGKAPNVEITKEGSFVLVAKNADGKESNPKTIKIEFLAKSPPDPPDNVRGTEKPEGNTIEWDWEFDPDKSDIIGFRLYRAEMPGGNFEPIADENDPGMGKDGGNKYLDESPPGGTCGKAYYVVAVYLDLDGTKRESAASTTSWFSSPCPN